jgi:hypothetical protein
VGSYLYSSLHDKLKEDKAGVKKALVMGRVSNMPCPAILDKRPSRLHIHPSNGVFVAVDGDVIYCSCSECKFEEDRNLLGGNLKLVQGTEGQRYSWAMLTEDAYKSLVSSASVTGKPCPFPEIHVCHSMLALFWSVGN